MTPQNLKILSQLIDAIVEAVKESKEHGAPGGILYAALMGHGFGLEEFEILMKVAVATKRIYKKGDLYFAT